MDLVETKDGKLIAEIHYLTDRKKIKNKRTTLNIRESLLACYSIIPLLNKKICIYFSDDDFIGKKMGGIAGDALEENLITLHINPVKNWKERLAGVIAHEYSHLAVLDSRRWSTILDSLVIEGIAENFREDVFGGKTPWIKSLTKSESRKLFQEIKNKLSLPIEKFYHDLFFGSSKYKTWSGYAIGYYIIKDFRKKYSNLEWKEIIKLNSKEILNKSEWL